MNILLVEDDSADALLVKRALARARGAPFLVEEAVHVQGAAERLRRGGIDAVLLDLGLPGSKGFEALEAVRSAAPRVAVVVVTGHGDQQRGREALLRGAQDFLVKGEFKAEELERAVRYAVGRNEASLVAARHADVLALVLRVLGHDLKAPLSAIQGYAELALSGPSDGDPAARADRLAKMMAKVAEAGAAMSVTMGNARAITAASAAPGASVPRAPLELCGAVRDAVRVLEPATTRRQVAVECDMPREATALVVPGFPSVIQNLIDNAVKYTAPKSTVTVRVRAGSPVAVQVLDEGPGVDPKDRERMFRPFERLAQGEGAEDGHGLGLAITATLVAWSGGTITVEGRPDGRRGSCFTVTLGGAPPPAADTHPR